MAKKKLLDADILKLIATHKKLCQEIELYNVAYFELNEPLVLDAVYDKKYLKLLDLEKKYGQYLNLADSPTQRVGGKLSPHLAIISHKNPMLSLANAWEDADIEKFYKRIVSIIDRQQQIDPLLVCEPKLDGLAVSIVYINGYLKYGVTRGNGFEGENITKNLRYVLNLPLKIVGQDIPHRVEVRGEILMKNDDFIRYNEEARLKNEKLFANTRNAAAGTLRQIYKSKLDVAKRLYVYAYGLENSPNNTHLEDLRTIEGWGFPIVEYVSTSNQVSDMIRYYHDIKEKKLDYQIDGVVYKLNLLTKRHLLGHTNKSPRWAIAYKFHNQSCHSFITDINFQMGRTGVLTPVAMIKPVQLEGVKINRVTLHNVNNIVEQGISVGASVQIERSGGVIPYIKSVDPKKDEKTFALPKECMFCGNKLEYRSVNLICSGGWSCKGQVIAKLDHMFSKNAFNVRGLGNNILELFVMQDIVHLPKDVFMLSEEILLKTPGFSNKKASNLLISIKNSKIIRLANFLYALGVNGLGLATAKLLVKNIDSLEKIMQITEQELQNIISIGPQTANSIYAFFRDVDNQKIIADLINCGIDLIK